MALSCSHCDHVISGDDGGRLPPWCPRCGVDLKVITDRPCPQPPPLPPLLPALPPPLPTSTAVQAIPEVRRPTGVTAGPLPPALDAVAPAPAVVVDDRPPVFRARRLGTWDAQDYRVAVVGDELLFVRDVDEASVGRAVAPLAFFAGGLIGGLIAWTLLSGQREQAVARKRRLDLADEHELRMLADESEGGFCVFANEVAWLEVNPGAFWTAFWHGTRHVALLEFEHQYRGRVRLALQTEQAARTALDALPHGFGHVLTANVRWERGRCVGIPKME